MTKCIVRAGAAMRVNGVLTWLMVDQVGSTSVTSDINGALGDTVKYSAYGEVRAGGTATDYLYTSQRNEAEIGLDFYVSRFYDPVIGHFIQADTIVPEAGSSKAYDRYGYVNNNPVRYNDPSGHRVCDEDYCLEKIRNGTGKNSMPTTVKNLLYGGFQDTQAIIRAYISAHPTYEPLKDPQLFNDRTALSFVAQAKMQSDDPKGYARSVISAQSIMNGVIAFYPMISKSIDLNEAFTGGGLPFSIGFGFDTFFQYIEDKEIENGTERLTRALIVGMENASVQQVSFAVMGGGGIVNSATGPLDVAIMATIYFSTNVALTTSIDDFNENKLFPYLKDRFSVLK